jgi:Glutaredoxin-like domain protein
MGESHISEEELLEIKDFLAKHLSNINDRIDLRVFLDDPNVCHYCTDTKLLTKLIAEINPKINVIYNNLQTNIEIARKYNITKAPVIILEKGNKNNIRYFGIPAGFEFPVFVETIASFANNFTKLSNATKEKLKIINRPVTIRVLVTLSCPYCPIAARLSNYFAIFNENIISEIIDVNEFEEFAIKYDVSAVPKIVINDKIELLGAHPEPKLVEAVLKAI